MFAGLDYFRWCFDSGMVLTLIRKVPAHSLLSSCVLVKNIPEHTNPSVAIAGCIRYFTVFSFRHKHKFAPCKR